MQNFIAVEIARHCPNPKPRSRLLVDDIPLVLWQILLLAEDGSYSRVGLIENISQLVGSASLKLTNGGLTVGEGDLMRKICGPLLARYSALCVSRRWSDADAQRAFVRSKAEDVFCNKFMRFLFKCTSRESQELINSLSAGRLSQALNSDDATALVNGQVACAATTPKVIELGRALFA